MNTRLMRRLTMLGAMLLILAACGGGGSASSTPTLPSVDGAVAEDRVATTSSNVPTDPEEAYREYTACMREHGIEMPDPSTADGVTTFELGDSTGELLNEASAECDEILDDAFGEFDLSPEQQAEMLDQELALAQCMRDNGVSEWPDPTGDGNRVVEFGADTDPDSVDAALRLCEPEIFGGEGGMVIGGEDSP